MTRFHYIIVLICCLTNFYPAQAQKMGEAWISLPEKIIPTIEKNRRMDMVDLYKAGHKASAATLLGGTAEIAAMGDTYIKVNLSACSTIQIKKLANGKHTLYAVITTVFGLAGNSRIALYDENWNELDASKYISLPQAADFILPPTETPNGKNEILARILLPTVQYVMNEATCDISALPTFDKTLDRETYKRIAPYIAPQLTYRWSGEKWVIESLTK